MAVATKIHGQSVSPESLALFLQEIIVEYDSYKENVRRIDVRENVSIPVEAVRLNDQLKPSGDPFYMVSRDISCGGVGLFNTEHVENGPIQLTFSSPVSGAELKVYATVEHCTPCGRYHIVGCRFAGGK